MKKIQEIYAGKRRLVKVCGLKNMDEIRRCLSSPVDMLGFLVADVESPRKISTEKASSLIKKIPERIETVAVDTSKKIGDSLEKLEKTGADLLQLHREDISRKKLENLSKKCRLIQVKKIKNKTPEVNIYGEYLLLDTLTEAPGGTGQTHNWEASKKFVEKNNVPVILAGGLGPKNIKKAVKKVKPAGVDAASKLEKNGEKDFGKVKIFATKAKAI